MVSKNQLKLISSLQQKKYRMANRLFIAEGHKVIGELLDSAYKLSAIYMTEDVFPDVGLQYKTMVTESELKKMSALSTANNCLAIFEIPEQQRPTSGGITIALDDIRDPGNLGTIIRLCDWFGIEEVVCSLETVDLYNPKVIQATMGSLARVNVTYTNLKEYLKQAAVPVFGTFMDGANIYAQPLPERAIVILGNEANGISSDIEKLVNRKLAIPRFGNLQKTESLNVATATAIILSEFCRSKAVNGK
jgi:TrmH family RNA methyltransferase